MNYYCIGYRVTIVALFPRTNWNCPECGAMLVTS